MHPSPPKPQPTNPTRMHASSSPKPTLIPSQQNPPVTDYHPVSNQPSTPDAHNKTHTHHTYIPALQPLNPALPVSMYMYIPTKPAQPVSNPRHHNPVMYYGATLKGNPTGHGIPATTTGEGGGGGGGGKHTVAVWTGMPR